MKPLSEAVPKKRLLSDDSLRKQYKIRSKTAVHTDEFKQLRSQKQSKAAYELSHIYLPWHLSVVFLIFVSSFLPSSCSAYNVQARVQLKSAVDACLKLSPKGKCFKGSQGPIGTWDVSRVTDMSRMFARAKLFDNDISRWDVSSTKSMRGMFLGANSFNCDLSRWDVSSVNDMNGMFLGATTFKRTLCGTAWVHSEASKDLMFEGSSGSISSTACTGTTIAVAFSEFSPQSKAELKTAVDAFIKKFPRGNGVHDEYGPIGEWDVSRVTDMSGMFAGKMWMNIDISKWDVSRVTDMSRMFSHAAFFNSDLSKWDVSRVTDMKRMFLYATAVNGDISKWDVSRVTDMSGMFNYAARFNDDVSTWDVSRVKNMSSMFWDAIFFNGDVSKWDVSTVEDMHGMFLHAEVFNGDLSTWDVSHVTDMDSMFWRAKSFKSDLSKWDVSNVDNMWKMFYEAESFDSNLSEWDVSKVTNMECMFSEATSFNSDISKWDVSRVEEMDDMFHGATAFTHQLCGDAWIESKAIKRRMFEDSSGSILCPMTTIPPFYSPHSRDQLKYGVSAALQCPFV